MAEREGVAHGLDDQSLPMVQLPIAKATGCHLHHDLIGKGLLLDLTEGKSAGLSQHSLLDFHM